MAKYKITLVDCENFDNKITLFINHAYMTISDGVFYAIEYQKGMSKSQIAKIDKFAASCPGPYMVNGHYYNDNFCKVIYYKHSTFGRTLVYRGGKYMHIFDITYVQGHRDMAYRIPIEEYKDIENVKDLIERMDFNGEDKAGSLERIYHGEKIF